MLGVLAEKGASASHLYSTNQPRLFPLWSKPHNQHIMCVCVLCRWLPALLCLRVSWLCSCAVHGVSTPLTGPPSMPARFPTGTTRPRCVCCVFRCVIQISLASRVQIGIFIHWGVFSVPVSWVYVESAQRSHSSARSPGRLRVLAKSGSGKARLLLRLYGLSSHVMHIRRYEWQGEGNPAVSIFCFL